MSMEVQTEQRYIYVLLSRTHTVPARLIRLFTKEPYSHASIALDIELKHMYSFARKRIYNPFDCGFIDENIETGIFGRDKNTYCSVYEVPVTEEQYQMLEEEINVFIKNREDYRYNYTGLVGVMFGKNIEDGRHFFCSQFVSYIFYKSGIMLHSKKSGLTRPYDFHIQLKDKRIYKGKLSEYRNFLRMRGVCTSGYLKEEWPQAM
ncbi:MAG: hypothetical protein IJ801_08250 [Lachnospiraceae bacterium]|nr:hypothetical protein [Lachnospiraceae bacterium]